MAKKKPTATVEKLLQWTDPLPGESKLFTLRIEDYGETYCYNHSALPAVHFVVNALKIWRVQHPIVQWLSCESAAKLLTPLSWSDGRRVLHAKLLPPAAYDQ